MKTFISLLCQHYCKIDRLQGKSCRICSPPAKKIAVNGVVLHYFGVPGDTDQPVAFPVAELHAEVTLEESSSADCIAVVDREKASVAETWPLKEARANFPLFLDEANHRLFVGCRSPAKVLVYDSTSDRLITSVGIASDTDDLFYDSANKLLYVSCGGGSVEVIKQNDADNYQKLNTIPTGSGARTSLFIPELKMFCLAVPHRWDQETEIRVYKTR